MHQSNHERILSLATDNPGQTTIDVREKLGIPKSTVNWNVKKLVADDELITIPCSMPTGGVLHKLYTPEHAKNNGITTELKETMPDSQLQFNRMMGALWITQKQ